MGIAPPSGRREGKSIASLIGLEPDGAATIEPTSPHGMVTPTTPGKSTKNRWKKWKNKIK